MKKNEIIQYLNNKYNFNIIDFTVKELKTFLNFEKKGYKIEKLTEKNIQLTKDFNNKRFNYSFIAIKQK